MAGLRDLVTCVITTSPIPAHPRTDIVENVYTSIRKQLPDVSVTFLADGVRPEQEHWRSNYDQYKTALQSKSWDVEIRPFPSFYHQAGMLRKYISDVDTPYLLFMEHDVQFVEREK